MAIYFVMTVAILMYAGIEKNININSKRKLRFIRFAFGIMIIISSLRAPLVGRDLASHYARNFQNIASTPWKQLPLFSAVSGYEIGYVCFCKILTLISDAPQMLIVVTSIITLTVLGRFIYKYSSNVFMSTILAITSCWFYMNLNIIRQALAIAIILVGYDFLRSEKKKIFRYTYFTGMVLIAALFHQSAIICLVFILFDLLKFERHHIVIAMFVVLVFYYLYDKLYTFILMFMGNSERYAAHVTSTTEGTGGIDIITIINIVLTFGAFVIGYFSLVWRKKYDRKTRISETKRQIMELKHEHSLLLYLSLMAGVFRLLTTQMNILNRASYYFLPFVFVLYPMAISQSRKWRKVNKYLIYFWFFGYFIVMTTKLAASYYGVVPYSFFWQ